MPANDFEQSCNAVTTLKIIIVNVMIFIPR